MPAMAEDVGSILRKRYDSLNAAQKKNDIRSIEKWFKAHCTGDFTYTSKDKNKYKLVDFLNGLRDQARITKKVDGSSLSVATVSLTASKAVLTTKSDYKAWVAFQGASLNVTDKSQTQEVWVKVSGQWKLRSIVQTASETQMFQR
jgi:hypothetical protein